MTLVYGSIIVLISHALIYKKGIFSEKSIQAMSMNLRKMIAQHRKNKKLKMKKKEK